MITKASDLLQAFVQQEIEKAAEIDMPHMPTLGEAYEEITKHGIRNDFVLPPNLNLKVVSGFIKVNEVQFPNQIDCMLVVGEGQRIGLTEKYIYDVENVLVMFEVKKTLTNSDLEDAYYHLASLRKAFSEFFAEQMDKGSIRPNIGSASIIFSQITGRIGPNTYDDMQYLTTEDKILFYTLVIEMLAPVNIIHGYGGYKTESGLRAAFVDCIDHNKLRVKINKKAIKKEIKDKHSYLGVNSIPALITSNSYSLIKTNARPYYTVNANKDEWAIMSSSNENPLRLMLEVIWTKISNYFDVGMPWGDGLEQELLTPLLFCKVMGDGEKYGWMYRSYHITEKKLKSLQRKKWEPVKISNGAIVIIRRMALYCKGIDINDDESNSLPEYISESFFEISSELLGTSYFALDEGVLITNHRTTYVIESSEGLGGWITSEYERLMLWKDEQKIGGCVIHAITLG
ncbi:TPA: DUF6602 domain-containing protein [Yersinia enterocolitica]|nr:hypothetical protein [Yersinia enterocolitica]HDL6772155.1 hypothetical protein [Yersinia enterocolitica]HDZ9580377.1 hypothetical protein [Yersinia enterocolitica]